MRLSPGPQGPLRVLVGVGAARAGPAGAGAEEDARAVARWVPAHLGCTIFIFFFFCQFQIWDGLSGCTTGVEGFSLGVCDGFGEEGVEAEAEQDKQQWERD